MNAVGGIPLEKLPLIPRIKLHLGILFLSVAMRLLDRPFWEEFGFQMYGELKGGRTKDEANQRHAELNSRLAKYLAGRGSGEWPPKTDSD